MYEAKIELEVTAGFESNYQDKIKQEVQEESCGEVGGSIEVKKMLVCDMQIGPSNLSIYLTSTNLDMFKATVNLLFHGSCRLLAKMMQTISLPVITPLYNMTLQVHPRRGGVCFSTP